MSPILEALIALAVCVLLGMFLLRQMPLAVAHDLDSSQPSGQGKLIQRATNLPHMRDIFLVVTVCHEHVSTRPRATRFADAATFRFMIKADRGGK